MDLTDIRLETVAADIFEPQRDAEYRALKGLAEALRTHPRPKTPVDALQIVTDLARDLLQARYAALAVTDERDRTEGFMTSGMTREELRGLRNPPLAHGPLGSLRGDGRPVRINDLAAHPKSFGFPPHHPQMRRLLGVPLWVKQQVRGSLYVTDRADDRPFDDDDERILVVLGRHASQIIEREWY